MARRGFTLIEILVGMAIAAVVMAILLPVMARAKRSARYQDEFQRLHQLHLMVALYQQDWDGGGRYGSLSEMGLPPFNSAQETDEFVHRNRSLLKSACGPNPMWLDGIRPIWEIVYRPANPIGFANYSTTYEENMLLFADFNCDEPGVPVANPYFAHRGLGVLLSGHLVHHYKPGKMMTDDAWWSSPARQP